MMKECINEWKNFMRKLINEILNEIKNILKREKMEVWER